jgi:hypothetical protein
VGIKKHESKIAETEATTRAFKLVEPTCSRRGWEESRRIDDMLTDPFEPDASWMDAGSEADVEVVEDVVLQGDGATFPE